MRRLPSCGWTRRFSASAPADNAYITPAEAQSEVLLELLKTRSFAIKAGQRFDLADELVDEDMHAPPDLGARTNCAPERAPSSASALCADQASGG